MKKMNNKGFSLVELIIVIAIMAILIVVLAPQYLKYVERGRNSTDLQNATEIVTAIQVYAADPEANPAFTTGDKFVISFPANAPASFTTANAAAQKALTDAAITIGDMKCTSKTKWSTFTIEGEVMSDGSIKFDYTSTPANAFAEAMSGKSGT